MAVAGIGETGSSTVAMTDSHLLQGLPEAPTRTHSSIPAPHALLRAAHADTSGESVWVGKKWRSSGLISEQHPCINPQLSVSCQCCSRSPSWLSPSADSRGDFGLALMVVTTLSQHGQESGRQGNDKEMLLGGFLGNKCISPKRTGGIFGLLHLLEGSANVLHPYDK